MKGRFLQMTALVLGLGIAAAGCGKYSISNIRALKAFQDANKLYQQQKFKDAIARYNDVISLDPQPPIKGFAYFFLGNSFDNMYKPSHKGEADNDANLPKAVDNYELAIKNLGGNAPKEAEIRKLSYEYLIAAYGADKLNDLNKAEPVAQQLISLEPNEPLNYQALGKLYEEAGRYEEAEANFKKAVDVRPSDPTVYITLAGFYNRQGKFDQTMEALTNRVKAEPNNPEAWHTIATYYQDEAYKDTRLTKAQKKDYTDKGLAADDKALAINPEYAEAMIYKNILLRMEANFETDPKRQKDLISQAEELYKKGTELQKKQQAAAGLAGGAKKSGGGDK